MLPEWSWMAWPTECGGVLEREERTKLSYFCESSIGQLEAFPIADVLYRKGESLDLEKQLCDPICCLHC
jgi:hypothetical protein